MTSVTTGSPFVSVPVLSSTAVTERPVSSIASDVLKSIPHLAPTPLETMIATGVASPSAHGQLTTRTATALVNAYGTGLPVRIHIKNTIKAMVMTEGTNIPETLSAIFAMGAFVEEASLTIPIICDKVVSSPTRSALHFKNPVVLMHAAETLSPGFLSTGTDSPVRADSFTAAFPLITTPSTGMALPARTTKTSPTFTSDAGI